MHYRRGEARRGEASARRGKKLIISRYFMPSGKLVGFTCTCKHMMHQLPSTLGILINVNFLSDHLHSS
jgi:hypothetical protein